MYYLTLYLWTRNQSLLPFCKSAICAFLWNSLCQNSLCIALAFSRALTSFQSVYINMVYIDFKLYLDVHAFVSSGGFKCAISIKFDNKDFTLSVEVNMERQTWTFA